MNVTEGPCAIVVTRSDTERDPNVSLDERCNGEIALGFCSTGETQPTICDFVWSLDREGARLFQ